jgi:uncharacterized protein YrrD
MALLRGSDLVGVPVVTLSGDDVADVRDVLFDAVQGVLLGFTLNKRGRLRGRMDESLAAKDVVAIGPNAIIIADASAVSVPGEADADATSNEPIGNVISDRVLTDSGVIIGKVTDVVIDAGVGAVVGFEIAPSEERKSRNGRKSYLPFHDTRSLSSDTLVVPAAAIDYIANDFAGFAEAVDRYRADLAESRAVR